VGWNQCLQIQCCMDAEIQSIPLETAINKMEANDVRLRSNVMKYRMLYSCVLLGIARFVG